LDEILLFEEQLGGKEQLVWKHQLVDGRGQLLRKVDGIV